MTTPAERTRAVIGLEEHALYLVNLYGHGKSAKVLVPREELRMLVGWLRHYPTRSELDMTAEVAPHLWAHPRG